MEQPHCVYEGGTPLLGTTAIWFPIVNEIALCSSKMARGGSHETVNAIWWTTPFGENVTHGSDVRWKSPPFAVVPPRADAEVRKRLGPRRAAVERR